jgi:two-component system sensor histidine kinase KdpD
LLALRELALRRTADRVDEDMRDYRRERSIGDVWPTRERCWWAWAAAPVTMPWCARWHAWHGGWRPTGWWSMWMRRSASIARAAQEAVLKTLALAARLGAETATIPGAHVAQAWWTLRASAMPVIWCWPGA